MSLFPKQIKLSESKDRLFISWNDNTNQVITLLKLRKLCPCATCLAEKENQSPTYIPLYSENQIKISSINQVGSYAITIVWQDGHNTGIYEFPYLRMIADKME
ncbi:MAG: DUF971 domain-containing protein [Ignavibacterium sp.]|nr:DUF971 domain-containing protein [Ignavibacterium sp.]MCX7611454.1 DUF971 domain-containing protein [Ignavibacterium sp.]MDW8374524.1 DUF971 domain-containing protein [Ignavibacteriales bacterium]